MKRLVIFLVLTVFVASLAGPVVAGSKEQDFQTLKQWREKYNLPIPDSELKEWTGHPRMGHWMNLQEKKYGVSGIRKTLKDIVRRKLQEEKVLRIVRVAIVTETETMFYDLQLNPRKSPHTISFNNGCEFLIYGAYSAEMTCPDGYIEKTIIQSAANHEYVTFGWGLPGTNVADLNWAEAEVKKPL